MFDSHQFLAYAVRLKPVYLSEADRTITKTNRGDTFQLSPAASSKSFP
jgi:hypothetical protein